MLWREQFEAVTLVWTLHHMADPEATLREVYCALKQGGRVLVGDWVLIEGQEAGECFKFTAGEIERLLVGAGFQNVNVEWVEPYLVLVIGEKNGNSASEADQAGPFSGAAGE